MSQLIDLGLSLVQLREQRRDLIVSLRRKNGPISGWQLIALQRVINACEELIVDLDAETEADLASLPLEHNVVCLRSL